MNTETYCTMDDIAVVLSQAGIDLRMDDAPPIDEDEILDEVGAIVDEYCFARYSPANLATSRWVKHRAKRIGAKVLCDRRGNLPPASIAANYDEILVRLEKVRLGQLNIADIPERKTAVPVLSVPRVRLRPFPHTVIEKTLGTGQPRDYKQIVDPLDQVNAYIDYSI